MLLDTNIVIDLFKGNLKVRTYLEGLPVLYIPSIVLGELYLGAFRSANPSKHLEKITNFLAKCTILDIDIETANFYGGIKAELLNKGKMIPENDIWIAAVAKQYKLLILTMDRHFESVSGIFVKFSI